MKRGKKSKKERKKERKREKRSDRGGASVIGKTEERPSREAGNICQTHIFSDLSRLRFTNV